MIVGAVVAVVAALALYVFYRNIMVQPPSGAGGPSADYDGAFYSRWLDPYIIGIHQLLARTAARAANDETKRTKRAVDLCCGTGQAAAKLVESGAFESVLGVDLSPKMIATARSKTSSVPGLNFVAGDATTVLKQYADDYFDVATICLSLHEMPRRFRVPMLREAGRVARTVVAVDFAADMPFTTVGGIRNRLIEFAAGPDHWANNRDFRFVSHGIPGVAAEAGLAVRSSRLLDGDSIQVATLEHLGE